MTASEHLRERLEALRSEEREALAAQILEQWEDLRWDAQLEDDAQATTADDSFVWFWIGSHRDYDRLVGG